MKLILKEHQYYEKLNDIKELIIKAEHIYNIEITFNNTITNNYRLIVFDNEYSFNDYNGVISCLKCLINIGEKKNEKRY